MLMTFYVRHLRHIMDRAGAEPSYRNKLLCDEAAREALGMEKAHADEVWEKVRKLLQGPEKERKEFEDKTVKILSRKLITG
jgi:hypothetical protein